jgi:gas vesicle protein
MKEVLIMKKIILVSLLLCLIFSGSLLFAQERGERRRIAMWKNAILFELLSEQDKKELADLRKTDKEKFREVARQKLRERGRELEELKSKNPEKFDKLVAQAREKAKQRMAEFVKKNPEKFKEFQKRRLERLKRELEYLKENDPDSYQKLLRIIKEKRDEGVHERHDRGIVDENGDIFD